MSDRDTILQQVGNYYTEKLQTHGTNHRGVDWNSPESQRLRFEQLLKLHRNVADPCSINDYGCGYGALIDYLVSQNYTFTYSGYDISKAMILAAQAQYGHLPSIRFAADEQQLGRADYTITSGIFNVRMEISNEAWLTYMLETIERVWSLSDKGIAFNCLTSYSDAEYMRENLYYADPCFLFDYCKKQLSKQVAILHDYGLYEFTVLVRREN